MPRLAEQDSTEMPVRMGVIGAGGQLGSSLVEAIQASKSADLVFATTHADLDLTRLDGFDAWLDEVLARPGSAPLDVVVNAAAHTKVDACETQAELAYQVNALAPAALARSLAERDVRFLHVSTDYVFPGLGPSRDGSDASDASDASGTSDASDGACGRPYREEDPTEPGTVYGKSKRAGEVAVLGTHPAALVVRTSWVFGPGRNFVVAILEQAEARRRGDAEGPLRVVDDQTGAPTYARDLAQALLDICSRPDRRLRNAKGLLHLRNAGETTWFGFAEKILELAGFDDVEIEPVATSEFKTAAPRPAYSVLDTSRARELGIELRSWSEALASYLGDRTQRSAASVQSAREESVHGVHQR